VNTIEIQVEERKQKATGVRVRLNQTDVLRGGIIPVGARIYTTSFDVAGPKPIPLANASKLLLEHRFKVGIKLQGRAAEALQTAKINIELIVE
jgi:hypothetical protein